MARYRTGLPAVPARRHEALPEGRALLHGEVRDREAQRAARPARQAPEGEARSATASSCARSRRSSASTACSRTSSARYFEAAERTRGITGETCSSMLERRLDNVVYPLGLRDLAGPGAPARPPRPLHGQRPEGRHPVVPRPKAGDVDRRQRTRARRTSASSTRWRGEGRAACPSGSRSTADDFAGQVCAPADARADQPARPGAADRGVVFEVRRRAASTRRRPRPAAVGDSVEHGFAKELEACLWKVSAAKRLEFDVETSRRFGRFYAQPFERGFGTTVGNALRRVLLSSIEGAADHGRQDRGRAARVLADPGRRRGRDRHHPEPEADPASSSTRTRHEDPSIDVERKGEVRARTSRGRRRRDPRAGRAHRDAVGRRRHARRWRCV